MRNFQGNKKRIAAVIAAFIVFIAAGPDGAAAKTNIEGKTQLPLAEMKNVLTDSEEFEFTPYDSIGDEEYSIFLIGNLVVTFDGNTTRYYGPDAKLIVAFEGEATSTLTLTSNHYVKENEGENLYRDLWLSASGKLDASEDWYSDYIWVRDTIINIETGKILKDDKFDSLYGSSSVYYNANFVDGVAMISVDDKYGMMDESGKIQVRPLYKSGLVTSGGYTIFENEEGKWAYCDAEGNMSNFKFTSLRDGGQSGILIGEIDKEYLYSTQEGNLLNLSEKLIINNGREYSLCANLPNCAVELGNFSNGYAHAVIRYYYVDAKLGLNTYMAFDGFVDLQGKKKLDFTDHAREDRDLVLSFSDLDSLEIGNALSPLNINVNAQPSIESNSFFKYGLLLTEMNGITIALEDGTEEQSKDFLTGYGVYNKLGKQLFYIKNRDEIIKAEVLGYDCIAIYDKNQVLTLKNALGEDKLAVTGVSNYATFMSSSGNPIVMVYTSDHSSGTDRTLVGIYYDETGFYTEQHYAAAKKAYTGNDDIIFDMQEDNSGFVTGKNGILIPMVTCSEIKPTGEGYAVLKESVSPSGYQIAFYDGNGEKIRTVKTIGYDISALPYGETGTMYTDDIVIMNNQYYDGLGKRLDKETFFTDKIRFNQGYTFVRKFNDVNYALMRSDGTLLTSYCFTKKEAIIHGDGTPNKYGSILIYLEDRLYRVHK